MTNFVHCRGCGDKIHESAPSCPKCGAPQFASPAASKASASSINLKTPSDYSEVPWFRKRWFVILCVIILAPVAGLLALTGPLYYQHKGETRVYPKSVKIVLYIVSAAAVVQIVMPDNSIRGTFLLALLGVVLVLGLKNNWQQD